MATFVSNGDRTGLLLYLLVLTKASSEPWDVSLHSSVWARAMGLPNPDSAAARGRVSKAWKRLAERNLVERSRRHRYAVVSLLREDGSGERYERPTRGFIQIPHELWTAGPSPQQRWYERLSLPALTFLLIALRNADRFGLPAERGPDYYGISADTLTRGARELRLAELLKIDKALITAPLAPSGVTAENRYTLRPPFGPQGTSSNATSRSR
ncbi:hypothetical protein [Candidatus Poriferisodalis sp.]|uniref:hypothetical protein n=1 Tax=Candidatus Poriferisodalis sp. TaxID=3101277 RepID=UPI003B521AFD